MDSKLSEVKIDCREVYKGSIFTVEKQNVKLPNGKIANRDVVINPNATAIVAIDEDKNVIMVRQHRVTAEKILLEIPAGKIDDCEEPIKCAHRELREETGYVAKNMKCLFSSRVSPGFCTEIIHIYMACDLSLGETDLDEDEFVEVVKIPLDTMIEKVMAGEIEDFKTVAGILAVARIMKV